MPNLFKAVRQGLEKESIRTDANGNTARTPHPTPLGAPLTHPNITLDFAEPQIEFVTPPFAREQSMRSFLKKLHDWTARHIGKELLWPLSMPPKLPAGGNISFANFGASADARIKHIYREGLKQRYGGAVQTISGIHYNFSLTDSFWKDYARRKGATGDLSMFKDNAYFGLMRNVIRNAPLVAYLFGASPGADKSFFRKTPKNLEKMGFSTYYGQFATSLRLSDFGYRNKNQSTASISYNSLGEYLSDLYRAVTTPSKLWSAIGVFRGKQQIQLNANILQLENEFYTSIRPKQKRHMHSDQSVVCSLACAGVEYVELRVLDIDPYEPAGISVDQLNFLHAFLLTCFLMPSPLFKKGEQQQWEDNQSLVALYGRKPGLTIRNGAREERFTDWSLKALKGIAKIAKELDKAYGTGDYSRVVNLQKDKILHPENTPSARIIRDIKASGKSFAEWGLSLAKNYKSKRLAVRLNEDYNEKMKDIAAASLKEVARIEARDGWILKGYEHLELSTQVLIRAAQNRGISVSVIDDELNVIELRKGEKKEVVKQATITRYDNYLSFELMKDKVLTKMFLKKAGLNTPRGGRFQSAEEAIDFCLEHRSRALVVKPATTNFGTGVSVIEAKRDKSYAPAVRWAFKYDTTILVEEFIAGKEYRFLVIDEKVIAVLNREPANIVGDGKHTIKELIQLKNTDPASYKLPDSYIKLGATERGLLAEAGLSANSVPDRAKKIYLRKNSNVHNGGDPLAIDNMPDFYKKIAVKAAATVGAKICGADIIIENLNAKPSKNSYSIIELNWNPAIFMHRYPFKGKPRDVGAAVLNFLGF